MGGKQKEEGHGGVGEQVAGVLSGEAASNTAQDGHIGREHPLLGGLWEPHR